MNLLMFGWEFPPLSTGGLGTACYGLTKALSKKGVEITFVLPYGEKISEQFAKFISPPNVKIKKVMSIITPYMSSLEYASALKGAKWRNIYGSTLFEEVYRYTLAAEKIAEEEDFDVVHCHDWMTFGAGIKAAEKKKKPLIVHVHATEFDRTGGNNLNQHVYGLEKQGMDKANKVIAVSNYTKNKITAHYGINPDKIAVVHNGIDSGDIACFDENFELKKNNKIVLFLGRVTLQKGPDYFVYAAKKVLRHEKNVKFVIAGSGDMEPHIIEKAAELGIADKVLFTGFLSKEETERIYRMADVFVMPSVSEPFGITPLEAIKNKTPAIISKNSGVSEVLANCLKVDFWDIDDISSKIIALLRYNTLHECLTENSFDEIKRINWDNAAEKCLSVYSQLTGQG